MAAGLGFKTFTTGEVLTAADVNGYLMQGVLVFASEAARDAAITSPQEGQFAYTKDNNSLWYYTGSAWAASGATGDIEGVTAGVGISGGGTSGTVTITNSMATEISAKGDLIAGTGSQTFDNLTVGANNTVLTADSSTATGLKWAAASSGAMTLISTTTLSSTASTITFNSIANTYQHLQIIYNATGADDYIRMTFNNVTTSTYYSQVMTLSGTTFTGTEFLANANMVCAMQNDTSSGVINIPNYKLTTIKKSISTLCGRRSGTNSNDTRLHSIYATNNSADAITRIDLTVPGVFGIGSTFSLYGVS